jgi:quinol monooxygenase YgiN
MICRYKDEEALKKHGKFPEFKEVNKMLVKEQLLDGKTQIFYLSHAAGFASRL